MNDELKTPSSQTLVISKVKKKKPKLYKVILLNDDYINNNLTFIE